jgi:glycosyltransferase involved in cell wall biosynthesis
MKVLILIQRFQLGGAEKQAALIAKYLMNEGHQIIITGFGKLTSPVNQWFEGIETIPLGFTEKILLTKHLSCIKKLKKIYFTYRFIRVLKKLRPDVLMPFTYEPNILAGKFWRQIGAKACIWNQRDEGRFFFDSQNELKALKACTHYVSNSTAGRLFLQERGIPNVLIIPNIVEKPTFKSKVEKDITAAAMVANLHAYKDHLNLLKAWKELKKMYSEDEIKPTLYLIGAFGNAKEVIESYIEKNNLRGLVILTGTMVNPEPVLNECQISVFSSNKEGLPNAVLESMALGLPVVATKIPGTIDALGEDYPYLIPPNDPISFAHAVFRLFNDDLERAKIGLSNQERVTEKFSKDRIGGMYTNLLNSI